ncbi:putative zinc finger in N-recognin-domain-containing protein [Boeremia exigua]|uniref:putative zinc finger in N-recognin-domain-containing protein n=1 Tax=Boeremia exigua TaxID=749465 RepID=UPI001E8E34B1|nr:putative zinc finger in N-recognin-domain-containing protein [Boeremia exigua]KAH6643886.1 putative zinc finger in N-recognin-domain-containing protein [Boeremia exigua]
MADSHSTTASAKPRTGSMSQLSESSQTAAEFIKEQLSLEAEAREALPYQFDTCTRDLGPLRQSLYACLTCSPPPASDAQVYTPAGVCYSCSISCHGEHTLVELFNKRNFVCDCGTTRMPENVPCTLRLNSKTGQKGDVAGEEPSKSNRYNQNFKNRFCGCGADYDAHEEKGTMFQCLGLGTVDEGGCGEDWWHPECLVGFTREEYAKSIEKPEVGDTNGTVTDVEANKKTIAEETNTSATQLLDAAALERNGVDGNDVAAEAEEVEDEDPPLPPGFPLEDDFDHFLCYKCVEANPWIRGYAGSPGFLPPVYNQRTLNAAQLAETPTLPDAATNGESKKRKASDDDEDRPDSSLSIPVAAKRQKSEDPTSALSSIPEDATTLDLPPVSKTEVPADCKLKALPPLPTAALANSFSLFLKPDFREHLCRCATHFTLLTPHPQLLEEEDTYEPPISEVGNEGAPSAGTGSLLDRGEAAFSNMDRVRAIQGAMAYAQLKDKVSAFLKPFAESGQAVGAEDVKAYFEKLRGDSQGIQEAAVGAKESRDDGDEGGPDSGSRKEQSGY